MNSLPEKKELYFNYIQRKRNATNQGQDKEMQDKAISFTKLSEGDVEMIKDVAKTHTDNSVTKRIKQQNKDDNIKKYNIYLSAITVLKILGK